MHSVPRYLTGLAAACALAACAQAVVTPPADGAGDAADATQDATDAADDAVRGDAADASAADVAADAPADVVPDVAPPRCGDGVLDPGEACDDGDEGNASAPDACRPDCSLPQCGDGILDSDEACDDGNAVDDDFCSNACVRDLGDLCSACSADANCDDLVDACVQLVEGGRCGISCDADADCPAGFVCDDVFTTGGAPTRQCVPTTGSCADCFDPDRDGYGAGPACDGIDCGPGDPAVYPGAPEACNGADDDCDGEVDEGLDADAWYPDTDGDGYGDGTAAARSSCAPLPGYVRNAGDCNDRSPLVFEGAVELCDRRDNDCDGDIDESAAAVDFYPDADGDGYGDAGARPTRSCDPIDGAVPNAGDCDDTDSAVSPVGVEVCGNGSDDDCNGATDCGDAVCADDISCRPSCVDDAAEDDDTDSEAVVISGSFEGRRVSCPGDDDRYAVDLAAGERLTVDVMFTHGSGDIDVQLLGPDGGIVASAVSVDDDERIETYTARSDGRHIVRVYLYAETDGVAGNDYTVALLVEPAP